MDRLERFGAFLIQKVQIVDRLEHQPPPGNSHNPFNQEALMMLSLFFVIIVAFGRLSPSKGCICHKKRKIKNSSYDIDHKPCSI